MMGHCTSKFIAAGIYVSFAFMSAAWAGDQAKAIINSVDPKSLNDLFNAVKTQPDAALTSIAPVAPNKYRFLIIWPAANPFMTYERVGRSFAERFLAFAGEMKPLASGFCLTSRNMLFGTTAYGEDEVNIAYRDIEVRYPLGRQDQCGGRYLTASEIGQLISPPPRAYSGYGAALPQQKEQHEPSSPEDQLKPFLSAPQAAPAER